MPRRPTPPEKKRAYNYKARYGLTVQEYEAMLLEQNGVCAICGNPPTRGLLHIDHDHAGGGVRELLCHGCNHGLGYIEDAAWMERAATYLKRHHPLRFEP